MSADDLTDRIEALELRLMDQQAAIDEMTRTLLDQEQILRLLGQGNVLAGRHHRRGQPPGQLRRQRLEVRPTMQIRAGDAAEEICVYAREHQVDLVLMGQRGLRNVRRLLLGRTVRRTLRRVDVPVGCEYSADIDACREVFEGMGIYSPTLGIIGAVMGLMAVMQNLADPSKLGGGIATAFVAVTLERLKEMGLEPRLVEEGVEVSVDG